jgi:dephospho-CoA kinase
LDFPKVLKKHCIALTGGIATGKSTVGKILSDLGYQVFDADVLARRVLVTNHAVINSLKAEFGESIFDTHNTLNREKLRSIIQDDSAKKTRLEAIMHPAIELELQLLIERSQLNHPPALFFYEAALIHEKNNASKYRETWCTLCSEETQVERLTHRLLQKQKAPSETMKHDAIKTAKKLISMQFSAAQKASLSTFVIDTNLPHLAIKEQIKKKLKDLS